VEQMDVPTVGSLTISLGVASWPQSAVEIEAVMKAADEMLYVSKRSGRNRVSAYPREIEKVC